MRTFRLCLLGLVAYLIAVVVLFPAAPVVNHFRPQLGPVALEGVKGKLYNGVIDRVRSTDDLLPLEFRNVGWVLSPKALLGGAAGAAIRFDGYGGSGSVDVARSFNGNVTISDLDYTAQAKELEVLLPVPIASFTGELLVQIDKLVLVNDLLKSANGKLTWNNAALETPVQTSLGTVNVIIEPKDEKSHVINVSAVGGEVLMDGSATVSLNGDFATNILFTPSPDASSAVINGLRQMGRADAQGRVRLQRQGNVNRLM
ncbi:type II secretion system protein N [Granulosicoccus antarcticus]|uniref:Type II secretion system protein N n=1 Tax=Granulosicoccus antarcticus IMCC3135 TaxID=1192854 RepID=A0A2Z2NYW9_9GAMM|nr:type II secretion system protein N [Granulosicoccus antarcticus]ASJ76646.1 hypothetical protein IMCC3135_33010 [Granulosicoccus antarcticus IMCC3135]